MGEDASYEEAHVEDVIDGRYTLRRQIARGGQATVFEAQHHVTGAHVALKSLMRHALALPDSRLRLLREARVLGALRHPNIASILDAGTCPKHGPYLALEMVEGRPLDGILLTRQRLPIGQAIAVLVQLCDALSEAHRHGVLHRDVKPGNLLVRHERGSDWLTLIDFGIASAEHTEVTQKLTKEGELLGTVEYMSPEQLMGTSVPGARSDVYAAGVVLFECLTGEVPLSGPPTTVIANMLAGSKPALRGKRDDVPRALEAVVLKALELEPSKRYPSVLDLAQAAVAACGVSVPPLELLEARADRAAPEVSRRRQFVRAPYIAPVRVLMANGSSADGRTEDISEGGVLMIMEGACGDNEKVRVRVGVPISGRIVELEGTTKWIKTRRGQRAIGVEFTRLPDEVRNEIRAYVSVMTRSEAAAQT